ncbi:hypothetical protein [Aestuariivirga sp.]|uniref:hypothetical protein n=1 Tax=Aestuariivirga sp. TaxID=2650926 RepID=UPI003BAD23BD
MSMMDFLNSAEKMLARAAEGHRRRTRTRHWQAQLQSPSDLRGRACHCPPDLPFHHVHSEGIREAADIVIDYGSNVENPLRPQIPVEMAARIAPLIPRAAIVHVKADLLAQATERMFPLLTEPIVLVTGDSDVSPAQAFRQLLDHPMLLHWFCQNADLPHPHPRLSPIPIGLDNPVYTKLEKRAGFLVDQLGGKSRFDLTCRRNDTGDQRRFNEAAAESRTASGAKPLRVLCTFHQNHRLAPDITGIPDRVAAAGALSRSGISDFVEKRLPQDQCWRLHSRFAFEASPAGNGLDCFRTWEALALGTVPIVRTGPLDLLYKAHGFPVAIVEDWEEVDATRLARWNEDLVPKLAEAHHRLANSYWTGLIRATADRLRTPS